MPFAGNHPNTSPGEMLPYSLDMNNQLAGGDTIASVTVVLLVLSGIDPNASSCLNGPTVITGNIVSQNVGGLLPGGLQAGVTYILAFTVTTASGRVLVNSGNISCVALT
jgi:hypothetical protein